MSCLSGTAFGYGRGLGGLGASCVQMVPVGRFEANPLRGYASAMRFESEDFVIVLTRKRSF